MDIHHTHHFCNIILPDLGVLLGMYSSNQAFTIKVSLTEIPKLRQFLKHLALSDKSFDIRPQNDNHIVISYGAEYTLPMWTIQLKRARLLAHAYERKLRILKNPALTRSGLAVMSGSTHEILPPEAFEAPMFQLAYAGNTALFSLPDTDLKTTDCFGLTILHYALGNIDLVQDIVREIPALVNTPDRHGCTPSMLAAANGQLAALKILKKAGADMRAVDSQGNNALHMAAIAGEITTMTWLVTEGEVALESRNSQKFTPYLWAAQVGQLEVLKTLKTLGADTSAVNQYQNNALHLAIVGAGDVTTIHWLVTETGLSVEQQEASHHRFHIFGYGDKEGKVPFLLAASRGQIEVLQILRILGADGKITNSQDKNALHKIAAVPMLGRCHLNTQLSNLALQPYLQLVELLAADFGYIATLEWLVHEVEIPVDSQDFTSKTPFLCAVEHGCLPLLDTFKKLGANLAAMDYEGNSALHIAVESKNLATIDWLTQEIKIDLEWCRTDHKTAFLYAAKHANLGMLQALQRSGADVTAVDDKNNNALHLAILSDSSQNSDLRCYFSTAESTPETEYHLDPMTKDPYIELITWLVNEAHLPLEAKGKRQMTAFLCAASRGDLKTLQFLQTLGANTGALDANGSNALHLATLKSHQDIIPWLVKEAKLDLESQSGEQKTAFLIAAKKNALSTLESLYELGANPHAVDSTGKHALDIMYSIGTITSKRNQCIIWLLNEVYANDSRYSTLRLIGDIKKSIDGDIKQPIDALEMLFTRHQALKTVILISNELKPLKMNRLIVCLIKYQKLTHLDISKNELNPMQLKGLGIALAANKFLEDLRLYANEITAGGLHQLLINGLAEHPNIKILDLRGNYFTDQAISVLVRGLTHNHVLETLYLTVSLTLKTSEELQSLLKEGPPLQRVILNGYQNTNDFQCLNSMLVTPNIEFSSLTCQLGLTDKEVCELASNLARHTNLSALCISGCELTKVEIAAFITASQAWSNLYQLELKIQGTEEVLALILELIQRLPFLSKLTLHGQCEPGCHLQPFVVSIMHTTRISKLNLRSLKLADPIEHKAFDAILHDLPTNPYLQELKLPCSEAMTDIEQQGLQTLLADNRDRAATISRYTQGAKRIKSATTKLTSSEPIATSSNSFFVSNLGDKRSQESTIENQEPPAAKRPKVNSP